jgi:Na+-transporting methylmalonyl-CoA/oxaloacetate decarboxylase gamma subunit
MAQSAVAATRLLVVCCPFVCFCFLFLLFLFIFFFNQSINQSKKKKKIGDEEVDIQHRMDNRCVFWSLCLLLKKKNHRASSSLDWKKVFSALRKF